MQQFNPADPDFIGIWIDCPSASIADLIGRNVVEGRLAASASRMPEVVRTVVRRGRVERSTETPLLLVTRSHLFDAVAEVAQALHPGDNPSIMAMPYSDTTRQYLTWLETHTAASVLAPAKAG